MGVVIVVTVLTVVADLSLLSSALYLLLFREADCPGWFGLELIATGRPDGCSTFGHENLLDAR